MLTITIIINSTKCIVYACRADKNPYRHDGRADKNPYRHDRFADSQCRSLSVCSGISTNRVFTSTSGELKMSCLRTITAVVWFRTLDLLL